MVIRTAGPLHADIHLFIPVVILLQPENLLSSSSSYSFEKLPPSDVSPSSSDSESSSDGAWHVPTITDFLRDVSSSVDRLVQISKAIRKSSAGSNNMKAEAYEEWENGPIGKVNKSKGFEDFVGVLLEHRYRDIHENLRFRLRSAISRCHRRIAYQRRHQPRLHYATLKNRKITYPSSAASVPVTVLPKPSSPSSAQIMPSNDALMLPVTATASSLGGTNVSASTLSPTFSPFDYDSSSSVSSGSTFSRFTANPFDDLPPAPQIGGNERYFTCPYCCIQLPRKKSKRRAWMYVKDSYLSSATS